VTLPTTPVAGESGAGQQAPPFPPALVEELLRLFGKAVRAHQLYLPNNPVYKGAIDAVRSAFAPIWAHAEELTLQFSETDVRWYDVTVFKENTKSSDSLPWTFFKDGVRELEVSRGFEQEELVKLFEILQRVRKASPDEDDLLTMLWEADFANLRYRYVDMGTESVAPLQEGGEKPQPAKPEVLASVFRSPAETQDRVVNMQDFDASLYFLDEGELHYLRSEIEREYRADLRENVIAIVLDIFESQSAASVRDEVCGIVETMLPLLLASGQLHTVAYLLSESQSAVDRGASVSPEHRSRLSLLPARLSEPIPLGQLLEALDLSTGVPPQELIELFQQLRPMALETVLSWLPRLRNAAAAEAVAAAADRLATAHPTELARLILSTDNTIALEAIRRSAAMKSAAAAVALAKVLADGDLTIRTAAVQALTEIGTPGALQALERSIADKDRDVRVAAVRALAAKGYKGVLSRLEGIVKGKQVRDADRTEKQAFFEAYGTLSGDAGVPYLEGILNPKGMFGKKEDPELRACAAIALGRAGTSAAREALQRAAADEKDVVVRNAVSRALRRDTSSGPVS
jgi:HEAT repeat protein